MRPSPPALEPLETRTLLAIPVSVNINTAQTFQTMQGMGASMIPWSFRDEYKNPAFFNLLVGDLGASMVRASILPNVEQVNDDNNPNTFNWSGFNPSALAAPFEFFKQFQAHGVDRFIGTVWTAPAWMKTNSAPTDGGSLRPEYYAEFAEYLSAVTQIAKNNFGINLTAISPQNEPYFIEPYESTVYTAEQYAPMLAAAVTKFNADGVTTKLLAVEDLIREDRNSWYLDKISKNPIAKDFIGAVAGHGLQGHWEAFRDVIAPYGREFWMTETSGQTATWEGAMGVANSIMSAVGDANASTYLYWQFTEKPISANFALMVDGQPTQKYYVAKQFYRWIRPGFVHVGSTSSASALRVATFRNPSTGALTTVVVNGGEAADVSFHLSGSNLPQSYKVIRSSSSENAVSLGTITGGSNFTMTIPGASVVTITNAPELPAVNNTTAVPLNTQFNGTVSFWQGKPFYTAALKGYDEVMRQLIGEGQDVNLALSNGWTALMMAAGSAHPTSIDTLKTLLEFGATVTPTNPEGWTALHAAAANTFFKFNAPDFMQADKITALLGKGADVNARDINNRTPLIWAAMMGSYDGFTQDPSLLRALLNGGANPFLTDNAGKTAVLDYANAGGYDRLADVLIAAMGLDTVKPSGNVVDVFPDPRTTPVTDFDIVFSERVQGFDLADITITRSGTNLPIPIDGGVLLTTEDDIRYHLAGLGGFTNGNGTYILSIKAAGSGITDPSGNPLAADFADTWFKGTNPPPPTEQKPFKGSPFAISKSGTTTIELEDYDLGGEGVAYHDVETKNQGNAYRTTEAPDVQPTTDAGGGFNIGYAKAGEWLEYTINVTDAGAYDFDFRLASTGSNGKFRVTIDGVDVTGAITVPNTGGYQTWQTLTKPNVNLSAGQHILRLALDTVSTNGSIGNFNWLRISPAGTPPPPNPQTPFKGSPFAIGSTATTLQIEDFDNGGEGIAYHDTDAVNSGSSSYRNGSGVDIDPTGDFMGGAHVSWTRAGEWLEYTINVSTAGSYNLEFRVASPGVGGRFHASIDGVDVTPQLQVPDTGNWNTFTSVIANGVNLPAGQHVLRVSLDTVGGNGFVGNFNSIIIRPAAATPGTTISATAAAYVRGGTHANTNFGPDPTLVVKKHGDPTSSRETYLTFNLAGVAPISSATLRLFGGLNDTSSASVQSQVFGGSAAVWDESTLTWNNRPGSGGSALSTVTVTGTTQQWYQFDVTTFLKAEQAAGRTTVTLVLKNPTQQNALVVFNSDEAASNRPEIALTT